MVPPRGGLPVRGPSQGAHRPGAGVHGGVPKHDLLMGLNIYLENLFHGKILIIQQNVLINLAMKIEQELKEHFIELVVFEIVNF